MNGYYSCSLIWVVIKRNLACREEKCLNVWICIVNTIECCFRIQTTVRKQRLVVAYLRNSQLYDSHSRCVVVWVCVCMCVCICVVLSVCFSVPTQVQFLTQLRISLSLCNDQCSVVCLSVHPSVRKFVRPPIRLWTKLNFVLFSETTKPLKFGTVVEVHDLSRFCDFECSSLKVIVTARSQTKKMILGFSPMLLILELGNLTDW